MNLAYLPRYECLPAINIFFPCQTTLRLTCRIAAKQVMLVSAQALAIQASTAWVRTREVQVACWQRTISGNNAFNLRKNPMQEHFYNVAYRVHENGEVKRHRSCLIRTSRVPTFDAARDYIRTHFLKDPAAVISFTQVESISKEVYLQLGGDPNAPMLKVDKN